MIFLKSAGLNDYYLTIIATVHVIAVSIVVIAILHLQYIICVYYYIVECNNLYSRKC